MYNSPLAYNGKLVFEVKMSGPIVRKIQYIPSGRICIKEINAKHKILKYNL